MFGVKIILTVFFCNKALKGPIPSVKIEFISGIKCDNPKTLILLLKLWNSICNRRYRTPNFSGGAPFLKL